MCEYTTTYLIVHAAIVLVATAWIIGVVGVVLGVI